MGWIKSRHIVANVSNVVDKRLQFRIYYYVDEAALSVIAFLAQIQYGIKVKIILTKVKKISDDGKALVF
ncbi:hypothetical protein ES703_101196 [subsurface metagenome]